MSTIISIILFTIFLCLSSLHFYWGFGGNWGNGAVIPNKDNNVKAEVPGAFPTFIVALGLLAFGILILMHEVNLGFNLPIWLDRVHKYGIRVIAIIFLLRAIGDLNI